MLAQVCPPLHSSRRLANIRSNTFVPLAFHICKTTRIPHSLHIENCGVVLHVSGGNSLNSRRLPYRLGVYLVAPGSPHNSSLTTLLSSNSAQKQRVLCVIHVRTLRLLSHLLCGVSVRLWPTLRISDIAFYQTSLRPQLRCNKLVWFTLSYHLDRPNSFDSLRVRRSSSYCTFVKRESRQMFE